ncbi:MAG: uroporphyrinogen decarboxylase family protein [Bryobacteraceae bacterium]
MSSAERVERALKGSDVDRVPFSFWHHFGDQALPAARHAASTLEFHDKFRTDLVKVMSDYPYPKPAGKWYEVRIEENPFAEQIRALEIIRDGLGGRAPFVETIFNPWTVAENLSSRETVMELKSGRPQALLDALEAIAESEAKHARKAAGAGAAGIFLAIANAQSDVLAPEDYAKFSEPFDRLVLNSVSGLPLNTLHLHGGKVYLDRFYKGWPAAINYSSFETGTAIARVRVNFAGPILGGIDERNFRNLSVAELEKQAETARIGAGKRFLLTPGCSIPNDTNEEEAMRLVKAAQA